MGVGGNDVLSEFEGDFFDGRYVVSIVHYGNYKLELSANLVFYDRIRQYC